MASNAPVRRNEPCPCGSGLRYKECHGKLGAAPAAPGLEARLQRALQDHQAGRLDEAQRAYEQVLQSDAGNAIATHYLGMIDWSRGELAEAERKMRSALERDASVPDFHNNLALLLGSLGRRDEAIAGYRRALQADPGWYEAHNNLGLALEDGLEWEAAEREYRAALARLPAFPAARQNIARLLLLLGRFDEAWDHYRWRLVARGLEHAPPRPDAPRLGADLAGRRFVLRGEQGVGDVLFFLRFAPELTRRGAALAFRGDARLHGMLERTGHFALGCAQDAVAADAMEPLFVGDLPWLTHAVEPSTFPPALPLQPLDARLCAMRSRLEATGPKPWIALTWRAGVATTGTARAQVKEAATDTLLGWARTRHGTWISVQRNPAAGSREELAQRLGQPIHDFSQANDDLEDMLALMALADEYIGPSNTNTHLRAGAGRSQTVYVPDPPEWRWMASGATSPWYPEMPILRPPRN